MKTLIIFTVISLFSLGANAACKKPELPVLPDANTTVTAEMVKAKNDVRAFVDAGNAYLDCMNGRATTSINTRKVNAMVNEMQTLGKTFNTMVRNYKARKLQVSS